MNIFFDSSIIHKEEKREALLKIVNLLPNKDVEQIDWIYIVSKKQKMEIFKGFKLPYDPYYVRKSKNGKPAIVISLETINKKKRSRLVHIVMRIIGLLYISVLFIPLALWCIKDRNIKFWYLMGESRIKSKKYKDIIGRTMFRIINYLLFYIGIHKSFDIYSSEKSYLNINMYEYASKYRDSKIDYIIENMKEQPLAIHGSW